jgi:hypothetical protein
MTANERRAAHRMAQARYQRSDKGRATQARYERSEKGRARHAAWREKQPPEYWDRVVIRRARRRIAERRVRGIEQIRQLLAQLGIQPPNNEVHP